MLTENDVVSYMCEYLIDKGDAIQQQLNTTKHGIDIIACKNHIQLMIEAKVATSASCTTNRIGLIFSPQQVKNHITMADGDKYVVLPFFWLPEDTLELRFRMDHVLYDVCELQDYIQTAENIRDNALKGANGFLDNLCFFINILEHLTLVIDKSCTYYEFV